MQCMLITKGKRPGGPVTYTKMQFRTRFPELLA